MGSTGVRGTSGTNARGQVTAKKTPPGTTTSGELDFNDYMIQNYGVGPDDLNDEDYERARREYLAYRNNR